MLRRRFRYETLLRVRKLREEEQAQKVAAIRREINNLERRLRSIQEEQQRILEDAGNAVIHEFDASDIQRLYNYERHLARLAADCDSQIAMYRRRETELLKQLEHAHRQKRVVERLKERHADLYRKEISDIEQKSVDEAASLRFQIPRESP